MKYIAIAAAALSVLSLASCGSMDRSVASWTGVARTCVDGVTYLQFTSGAVAQRTIDDKLVAC